MWVCVCSFLSLLLFIDDCLFGSFHTIAIHLFCTRFFHNHNSKDFLFRSFSLSCKLHLYTCVATFSICSSQPEKKKRIYVELDRYTYVCDGCTFRNKTDPLRMLDSVRALTNGKNIFQTFHSETNKRCSRAMPVCSSCFRKIHTDVCVCSQWYCH